MFLTVCSRIDVIFLLLVFILPSTILLNVRFRLADSAPGFLSTLATLAYVRFMTVFARLESMHITPEIPA